jgi:phosphohistidine swiveling domain-containing protein
MMLSGAGNGCGRATGRCSIVRAPFSDRNLDSAILLLDSADAAAVVLLDRVVGVCVANGGLTSHLAIICTEMGLPFLTLGGSCSIQVAGDWATLDSDAGEIYLVSAT